MSAVMNWWTSSRLYIKLLLTKAKMRSVHKRNEQLYKKREVRLKRNNALLQKQIHKLTEENEILQCK